MPSTRFTWDISSVSSKQRDCAKSFISLFPTERIRLTFRSELRSDGYISSQSILEMCGQSLLKTSSPTKKTMSKSCGQRTAERSEKVSDVVFCGGDYDENSFWNKCYPDSDFVVFPRNEYNSTDIRKDIYGHWDWMPQIVRSYFTKRVLMIGGESSGKSTLTVNLANYFNTVYLEEVGRDLSELSGTDVYMLSEDFTRILLEHKAKEMRLIEQSDKVFFEDTDCLITRFFMDFFEDENIEKNERLAEAIAELNSYDLILYLEPDVEWVQDGGRSDIIAADRKKYGDMIKALYTKYGFEFKTISGDYNNRFDQAVKYVKELLKDQSY